MAGRRVLGAVFRRLNYPERQNLCVANRLQLELGIKLVRFFRRCGADEP